MMDIEVDPDKKNSKSRVKVAIRVRPMIARELVSHQRACVEFPSKNQIIIGSDRNYKFDRVFKETSPQQQVYDDCIKDLILGCFEGYNAAVLAYGQTGSISIAISGGKTYTMGTNTTTMGCNEQGMIPKVIHQIFNQIEKRKNEAQFNVKASFLQIYNEQIIDLLEGHKNIKQKYIDVRVKESGISIREQKDGSVSICGVIEEQVQNSAQMLTLLDKGSINRTTAATMMNQSSSRSHAIFTIFLEQHPINQETEGFITAKFFFVDLAGSERAKKTGATGVTLKEGININLGLLQLGNVISALAVDKKEAQFITYRNSKLTRILQDSLGGNSNTYMIACISPAESNYQESLNTLKYASKAMNIKNKPVINRDPHSSIINSLRQRIAELEVENQKLKQLLKGQGIDYITTSHQKKSSAQQQLKTLSVKYTILERKNQKIFIDLKEEKKRKNQLEIQTYQLQREKDIMASLLEQIKTNHPNVAFNIGDQNIPLIENYLHKIQQLQTEILDKQKINNQLQIQYTKIRQISQKDEQILIKKNETIYNLVRQNKQLKKVIKQMKKQIYRMNNIDEIENQEESNEMSIIHEVLEEEQSLEADESFNQEVRAFNENQQNLKTELKRVEHFISQKENILNSITNEQMELEYKLIQQMKEQYHQKINELQKQKNHLIKQQRTQINTQNINRYSQKIDLLENQLRQFRNKAKEQKQLEQKLSQQSNVIKSLGNDIKNFKVQKIQLHRKLKEDKENFQKFKQKRTQELMISKRENAKKDVQIRKLTNENKKKSLHVLKKNDELKRIKKVNDTLKRLMKPKKRKNLRDQNKDSTGNRSEIFAQQKQLDELIGKCLKNMLLKVDREFDIQKYSNKCAEIDKELESLVRDQSNLHLKMERLQLQQEESYQQNDDNRTYRQSTEMRLNLNQLAERINNLEENREFCIKKYQELFLCNQERHVYNYENQIIYNPAYDNIDTLRQIMKAIFRALQRLLTQDYQIKVFNEELNIKNGTLQNQIEQLKQNIVKINIQSQQNLTRLREQMMFRMYQNDLEEENDNYDTNKLNLNQNPSIKLNQRQKKNLQRKIIELTRNNNKLSSDLEVWRRKCGIIQDKYQSLRSLFDKDKFIGRPIRQEENNINHTNNSRKQQSRKYNFSTPLNYQGKVANGSQNSNLMDELNSMAEKLKTNLRGVKKTLNFIDQSNADEDNKEIPDHDRSLSFTKYKWECISTIDAHSSPILSIKNYKHLLISAATRNIRLWDLQTNQLSSDITGVNLNSFVKSLSVSNEKQLLAASCDKLITLWDLRTSNNEGVLRGHKDQIRTIKIVNNYLFSAGKGLTNSGGLLVWDLRYLNFNNPIYILYGTLNSTQTSHNNILYYGTRDHHVRRLNIDNMQTLTTFQPPHMDTVTGLAISKGYLISGSKDKNLRLWSLDNSIYNLKSTIHAFNDYINTVQNDNYHPVFYSGDRTGQVKVGTIIKEKIEFLGIISHTQSVNAICSLQYNKGITATGSTDKTIKLWQPNAETFHQIENSLC